ncbi:MAG: hypothetical protein AAGA48_14460 [Myxococcota bacterium]
MKPHSPSTLAVLAWTTSCVANVQSVPEEPFNQTPIGQETIESEPKGKTAPCLVDEEVPASVYVRRVKNLLTGAAPTDDEMLRVQANPNTMRELVAEWQQTVGYERKLGEFFGKALQQTGDDSDISRQLHNGMNGIAVARRTADVIRASFVRTALRIARNGEPFTNVTHTATWDMTTAMMAWLIAVDQSPNVESYLFYEDPVTLGDLTFDADTPLDVQAAHEMWHASLDEGCEQPYAIDQGGVTLKILSVKAILGEPRSPVYCNVHTDIFNDSDWEDWRPVTMVPSTDANQVEYWDAPSLRNRTTLGLDLPRTGFFMAPAFLAAWETNDDNSFRVTTNQALIAALGTQFDAEDVTLPLGDEGLADDHAAPDTACYGCHKNLDPMRNYFKNALTSPFYAIRPEDSDVERATFSFQGAEGGKGDGETLADFGQHLANHPRFAHGWVQKLCYYANSQDCDSNDPEFPRIVEAFVDSGFDFNALVVDLFSSPLITRAHCAEDYVREFAPNSIARRDHLCAAMVERLGIPDICTTSRSGVEDLVNALPEDQWPRGKESPEQPTEPALVYAAATKAVCLAMADTAVDRTPSSLDSNDLDGALDQLVTQVMGLPPADPRHTPVKERLHQLVDDAEATGITRASDRLKSAFIVACTSPFVTSVDL